MDSNKIFESEEDERIYLEAENKMLRDEREKKDDSLLETIKFIFTDLLNPFKKSSSISL